MYWYDYYMSKSNEPSTRSVLALFPMIKIKT